MNYTKTFIISHPRTVFYSYATNFDTTVKMPTDYLFHHKAMWHVCGPLASIVRFVTPLRAKHNA